MSRKMADCRRFASVMNCSLVIIGEEDEVVVAVRLYLPHANELP